MSLKVSINLEEVLKNKNISLTYLATRTGISYQQLWNIKEGRTKKVYFETIGLLLDACGCTLNELFKITK